MITEDQYRQIVEQNKVIQEGQKTILNQQALIISMLAKPEDGKAPLKRAVELGEKLLKRKRK